MFLVNAYSYFYFGWTSTEITMIDCISLNSLLYNELSALQLSILAPVDYWAEGGSLIVGASLLDADCTAKQSNKMDQFFFLKLLKYILLLTYNFIV